MEKIMLSAEEEDKQSEEGGEEESEDEDVKLEDGGNDEDKKPEAKPQDKDGKVAPPTKAKKKEESDVLNLNNEVVKMRKEVKRVRALVIRKLTRQIVVLKKKKGKEAVVEKNQRRAARLLEELHAMKDLAPDLVTKTALQKNLNFEVVCKNPKSTISDRALARIATHPQFNKKIQAIKAAVKAFKDERRKGGKLVARELVQTEPAKASQQPSDKSSEREIKKKEDAIAATPRKVKADEVNVMEDADNAAVSETEQVCSDAPETPESIGVEPVEIKICDVKQTESTQIERRDAKKPLSPKPAAAAEPQRTRNDDNESDLESSGDEEEKEYFDDSTEERFRKQSSQSEESDDDDFFLGKVSKFKKKKPKSEGGEQKEEVKKESEKPSDKLQSELDELESRLKSKGKALQSVFCSSLGGAKAGRGGGRGRGRGGDRFRGPTGGGGPSRDFNQQSKYQRGSESSSVSKYSKPCPEARHQESGDRGGRGRGRGRGRGDAFRHNDPRAFSHQAPRQALHPSWEASKKRKEQQGQILAFQGKKIKFDDDD